MLQINPALAPERPAGGRQDEPFDFTCPPRAQRLGHRGMLRIHGHDLIGRCMAWRTSGPPATRDSLFASARVDPAASAAKVAGKPTEPVIPLRTISAPLPAILDDAAGPVIISVRCHSARPS